MFLSMGHGISNAVKLYNVTTNDGPTIPLPSVKTVSVMHDTNFVIVSPLSGSQRFELITNLVAF